MALVVLLRGVNVGGHRRLRPSLLARELRRFDVVNIGAAGTLVVRKPGPMSVFRAALAAKLPFQAETVLCTGPEFLRAVAAHPFGPEAPPPGETRFVTIVSKPSPLRQVPPFQFPAQGEWLVRVLAARGAPGQATVRFLFGAYRRHMKTIGFLGKLDRLCDVPVTTRNWNTVQAVVRALSGT
ncbi:MAG TPA: DUF1697 domain-containing protein [Terriglobales bacterium]|nr:DUF1697 domain-containing protein [Terriglobales bacterium]